MFKIIQQSHIIRKMTEKKKLHNESTSANLTRVWLHWALLLKQHTPQVKQIKYHVPWTVEVKGSVGLPLLPWATSLQTAKPDTGSGLPDWLSQCADLHCDLSWLSFIFRSQRLAIHVPPQACVANAPRDYWCTIIAPIKPIHLERVNQLHSFCPQSRKT